MVVPRWVLGRHLTAITVTPLVRDAQGTLTITTLGTVLGRSAQSATAAKSLSGYVDGVRFGSRPAQDLIMPIDQTVANYEIMYDDFDLQLIEILHIKTTGSAGYAPILPYLAANYEYFLVSFTRGGQTWDCYFKRGDFTDGVQGFGKNSVGLSMRPFTMIDSTATVTFTP